MNPTVALQVVAMSTSDARLVDRLNGTKYQTWNVRMQMYLQREELWILVNGITARPTTATEQPEWDTKNGKAKGTILLFITDHQITFVKNFDIFKKVWDFLKAKYQKSKEFPHKEIL